MHCVWTLPEGDSGYATRIGAIKARFTMWVRRSGFTPTPAHNRYGVKAGRDRVGVNPDLRLIIVFRKLIAPKIYENRSQHGWRRAVNKQV